MTDATASGTMQDAAVGPTAGRERKASLDTLRGAAVLGILLMNIVGMAMGMAYDNPTIYGGAEGANLAAWVINSLFFDGTMRGLFSLMFGASVILITSRAEARGGGIEVADIYFRRNLWLFVFGLVHAWLLLWPGDILYNYAICGMFLFAFRNLRPRTLIILGLLVSASLLPKDAYEYLGTMQVWEEAQVAQEAQAQLGEDEELSEEHQAALDAWDEIEKSVRPSEEDIQEEIDGARGDYFTIIATSADIVIWFQSTGFYLWNFFDSMSMMFIGMALLKLGVLTGERSTRFYLGMIVIGYGIGILVNSYEARLLLGSDFGIFESIQANFTFDLGRITTTLGHVGFWMLICKRGWLKFLTDRLAAVGRMALTNYIMQSVIGAIIFTGIGFGLYGSLERFELYYVVAGIWLFQLIVSPVWMKHFRFGPLEWLWRSLTYKQKQPMRRQPTETGTSMS